MKYSKNFMMWVNGMTERAIADPNCYNLFLFNKTKEEHRGIISIDIITGKTATSYCSPTDKWDNSIGIAIAYARLRGIAVPEMEVLPTVKECIGKWVKLQGGCIIYVTPIYNQIHELNALDNKGNKVYVKEDAVCKIIKQ